MISWMFLKIFGDVCFYVSVIGAFPGLFPHTFSLLWPALLCGAGAGTAALFTAFDRKALRFLGLLPPLFSLILAGSWMELLILLPPLLYTAVVILRGTLALEYYSCREFFLRSLIPWGLFFLTISIFYYFEELTNPLQTMLNYDAPLRYGLLYAFSGVLLLRQLRMGEASGAQQKAMNRTQMVMTLGISGASLLGIVVLERLLHEKATSILRLLFQLFSLIFTIPAKLIASLFDGEFKPLPDSVESPPPATTVTPSTRPSIEGVEEVIRDTADAAPSWWPVALTLLVLLIVFLCMLKLFRTRSTSVSSEEATERVSVAKRESKPSRRSNRNKVRHLYRQFLKEEQKKGLKRKPSHTSADILHSISPDTNAQAAAELREVYLRARYDERSDITQEQVNAARSALKKSH